MALDWETLEKGRLLDAVAAAVPFRVSCLVDHF